MYMNGLGCPRIGKWEHMRRSELNAPVADANDDDGMSVCLNIERIRFLRCDF